MIVSFANKGTEDVYNGVGSASARRTCPTSLWPVARCKMDQIESAASLDDLKAPPGNRLERLRGDRRGQYSIRINERYRVCFRWTSQGAEQVEVADYH